MKPHPYPIHIEGHGDVYFTQEITPFGRERDQWVPRPMDVYNKAKELYEKNFRLHAINHDDIVTISCFDGENLINQLTCINGPTVPKVVDEIINGAYERLINKNEHT